MEVDIVYTWVNGNDQGWRKKRDAAAAQAGIPLSAHANCEERYESHDELKYSLRSIAIFAPWVRRIFIVTDGQTPEWLNLGNSKVKIVDHREIFPDVGVLPTFNSMVIESCLQRIEGLAEDFIYFNDDMFLGRPVNKADFFRGSSQPLIFGKKKGWLSGNHSGIKDRSVRNENHAALYNSKMLLKEEYGFFSQISLRHGPMALSKSVLFELERVFKDQINSLRRNRFRTMSDIILPYMHCYYLQYRKNFLLDNIRQLSSSSVFDRITGKFRKSFVLINLSNKNFKRRMDLAARCRPFAFCINSYVNNLPDAFLYAAQFMEEYFPEKSEFEI